MASFNPSSNPASSNSATPNPFANRRRSTRVWHEAALVVRIPMPDGRIIEQEGRTFAVNVHGGLLRLSVDVEAGLTFEVMNPATQMVCGCRVVRAERAPEGYLKVGFAFDRPSPRFWDVAHPPDDWGIKRS